MKRANPGPARVDFVVVPSLKPGRAYARTPNGRFVSFTGSREEMLAPCSEHRHHGLNLRGPVFVDVGDWTDVVLGDPETSAA